MRTKNSLINIAVSCTSYFIILVGSFVTRQLFARTLGLETVGIDGVFTNVVSALAIVELGLGVGIVYKLYKPIAEKNWEQVSVVLCFLRKCYVIIAAVALALGIISVYFVVTPIKGDFSKIWLSRIFLLYVADVVTSYLYSHKRAMFIADQRNYVNNIIHIAVQILLFASQIAVLKIFAVFELYLVCKILSRVIENVIISYRFDKKYSFINLKIKKCMPEIEKKDLFKNIKALFFHKISGFSTTAVSSLIIAYYISLKENGIYYNYMLIVMALTTVTNEVFNGIIASFGNLLTTSGKDKAYSNFNVLYFVNFLLYSFITTSFLCIATPFMGMWTGEGSAFNFGTTAAIAAYLYFYGMRQSVGMAKTSAGIYDPDKYFAVVGAVITFVFSLILVRTMGISGVMLGNIIGIIAIPYWVQPYLVYDGIFRKKATSYHTKFVLYTFLTVVYSALSYALCGLARENSKTFEFMHLFLASKVHLSASSAHLTSQIIVNMFVCLIVPNVLNIIFFCKTREFKDLFSIAKSLLKKVRK